MLNVSLIRVAEDMILFFGDKCLQEKPSYDSYYFSVSAKGKWERGRINYAYLTKLGNYIERNFEEK